jgi:hypothetical protein
MFKNLNDILYIKFIKNDFLQHHSKYNNSYSLKKKQIKSHITHPIFMKMHPCPLLHDKKHFSLEKVFQIM